jgi:2-octaprenyl-6-methoxyphenol hydroxylase
MVEYNALRRAEVLPRQQLIDLMNKSLLLGFFPLEAARAAGLSALHYFGPLKRFVMQQGLQPRHNLPFAMRAS